MFREFLVSKCREDFGHNVVGSCGTDEEAMQLCKETSPEIAIIDLHLGDNNGLALSVELLIISPNLRIIIMTTGCQEVIAKHIASAPIMGYVDKNSSADDIAEAIKSVGEGQKYFSKKFHEVQSNARKDPLAWTKVISDAELKILPSLGSGLETKQIAALFCLQDETVASHRRSIMRKLQLQTQNDLMNFCLSKGFIASSNGKTKAISLPRPQFLFPKV